VIRSLLIRAALIVVLVLIMGIGPWAAGFVVGAMVGIIGTFGAIRYLIDRGRISVNRQ
jgi:hypothetical protein